MLPWMDAVAQSTTNAAQRAQGQAEHWATAKNSVPPVPRAPQSAGFFSNPGEWAAEKVDWFPGVTSEEEKAQQRQQDAAEQARQAMRVYQASSNSNVDPAPAFTTPQALDASVGALPLTDPRLASAGATAPVLAGGGAPAHLLATHQPQPAAHQPATYQPATYQPAATVSQLAQSGPANTAGTAAPLPGRWASNLTPGQGLSPGALPIGAGLGEGTAGRGTARGATTGARVSGGTRGGTAGHAAGFGTRPSPGFGPRPATSAHPSIEEMSGSRGSAEPAGTTRGTAAAGYQQPFAASANQRGEDHEHRTKYLVHDDSHTIVGDLPPTAPPVIGADY
jgi:hypothetical protein